MAQCAAASMGAALRDWVAGTFPDQSAQHFLERGRGA